MQVKNLKSEGLSHELEITIPANDIEQRVDARLAEVQKTHSEPGFREGKVPMARMKQKYGKAIMGEVLESAVNETSQAALEKEKLQPAMQPKIEVKSFDDGKDLVYTVAVEVLPEFKLVDCKKLKFEKPVAKPEKKNIDEALERIASQNKSSKKISGDRKTKDGDIVLMDFDGRTADDNVKQDGMAAEGHKLKLGSNQFIPGFEDQLIGQKAGDKIEVKVTFPENYGAADLAGRDAIFDVTIHEIHEEADAEINEDFAKTLGMEDVAALEKAVEEQIQKEFDNYSRMRMKKNLLDELDKAHDFDVPPGMLEMEYDTIIKQIEQEQAQQNPGEKVEISDEDKEEFKSIAVRRVKLGLVLSEIGRENNIEVTQADLQKAVIEQAQNYPGQEKEVFDFYSKNQQALDSLRAPMFEEKTVDFIIELADVKEVEMSPEELTKDDDEEEAPKAKKKPAAKKKAAAKKDD